ncbi:MAG: TlpA family protein disulfide reductase [Candidatus Omnitrophica bacterium]|nr:TlpA family protein disulfide reductase [Candidatus Omnitrophota bacterium]
MLLVSLGCESSISPDWQRVEGDVPAPDFTLPRLDGDPVSLQELRGQVVIMEFWATWCGPCRFSLPSLEVIYRKYRDRGVTVLLINQGESPPPVRRWAAGRFTAPILLDEHGDIGSRYHVSGIPRLFIVGPDGNLVYEHSGYGGGLEHNLHLILKDLLGEPADA